MAERRQRGLVVVALVATGLALPAGAAAAAPAGDAKASSHRGGSVPCHRTVKPSRRCHVRATFRVRGGWLGRASQTRSELLGSRGVDPEHLAPAAIQAYGPVTLGREGLVR